MCIGVVVIGRNEGDRLRRCLDSVVQTASVSSCRVVYVDSGSTDGSAELAGSMGVEVIALDMRFSFSAARARNEGFRKLRLTVPDLQFVQFVDGDCEIAPDWLLDARATLAERPDLAVVAGKLKERFPEASIYNRLAELEWNFGGSGEVESVGGIFMIRRKAFEEVEGFDDTVTAGEEPELCQRLRRRGWIVLRLARDMAWHDLGMTRFGQWWRRAVRGGYGGLDVARRFGLREFKRNSWRVTFWSCWPALILLSGGVAGWIGGDGLGFLTALLVFLLGPAHFARIALRTRRGGQPTGVSLAYAFFTMLSFCPQMLGQLRYLMDRLNGRAPSLMEWKNGISA